MDHPQLAQLAAVVAVPGVVLVLAGHGRAMVLGGLALLAGATLALVAADSGLGGADALASPAGLVGAVVGLGAVAAAAYALIRNPSWLTPAVLVAAPLRPPIAFDPAGGGFPISIASDGQLGRLLPLYFVLGAAVLAVAWRAIDGDRGAVRALPRAIAWPAAAFVGAACLSLLWADRVASGVELLTYFTLPFALLLALLARAPYPDWAPRRLGTIAVALATVFALVGLYQAVTRELFFFAPNLAVSNANSDFFRVTSLFGDPSLYGRHVVLGIGVLIVALTLGAVRARTGLVLLAVLWLGLLFSYSQSSMVALIAVCLAVATATGGRRTRRVVLGGLAAVVALGVAYAVSIEVRGNSLRTETADRSERVIETARVVREDPLIGVGIGNQAEATRRLSDRDRTTPNFVSHTTPLTVAAELGLVGLGLYGWLLVGGARLIGAVTRLERGLGLALGASFLALFVHSLFYSGFLEDPLTWVVLGVGAGFLTWTRRDDGVRRPLAAEAAA